MRVCLGPHALLRLKMGAKHMRVLLTHVHLVVAASRYVQQNGLRDNSPRRRIKARRAN